MSADEDDGPGTREVAHRLFAAEFEDADFSYAESDEERAPNYVVTPTGARVNRLFAVGVLTEVEAVGEDVLRGRVVDPTGAFVVYAGQYQPDTQTFLERAEPPAFVAVTGKARTFQPEDSDVVYTSIRPESVNEVDAETRDRWVVGTVERTLDRIGVAAAALDSDARGDELAAQLRAAGVDESLAAGLPLAIDHYGTTGAYLTAVRDLAVDAARVVAGEREEVGSLSLSPGDGGDGDLASLASLDLASSAAEAGADTVATETDTDPQTAADSRVGTAGADDGETGIESASGSTAAANGESEGTDGDSEGTDGDSEPTTAATERESGSATGGTESAGDTRSETASPTGTASESPEPTVTANSGGTESPADTDAVADDADGSEPPADPDSLGESEPAAADPDSLGESEPAAEDIGDFEPGEFDLDEEVREEVESEYGTDFQSGTEVEAPGEVDIETPDPEELAEAEAAGEPTAAEASTAADAEAEAATDESVSAEADGTAAATDDETTDDDADGGAAAEPAEDVDLEDAVMDAMDELDDGDGADREAVIDHVADLTGADPEEVEDAIQSALMDGRCYEPDEATLKPI